MVVIASSIKKGDRGRRSGKRTVFYHGKQSVLVVMDVVVSGML